LETKGFLTLEDVGREDIREILDLARAFAEGRIRVALEGKTVCLAFFEASTRTAVSFELAARRSGAHVISLSEKGSAIAKGESLIDTVVTLDRFGTRPPELRPSPPATPLRP
jgi:aspartate carbamoyltransferase catalytic subunit